MLRRTFLGAAACTVVASPLAALAGGISPRVPRDHGPTTRRVVEAATGYRPGTIVISNSKRTLDLVLDAGRVARYTIALGRPGFEWTGEAAVGHKSEWPTWRPPSEMRRREPDLPEAVPPGPFNPLGARALYLYSNGRDTLYRIHGTNDRSTVGGYETSGCFRLTNADILELFGRVPIGTKVIVLN
ncbi:L,D-transpeptidase [Oricola cellulosilytica]|uniref:L,D-transpeptidase n=1 Tax=Oricola cellulosilytica TaxID=1429082 RepID=A0A4R0PH34_9HYPH|nr:L,D-transpeptidase [Oricola cellulosilytica]TCD16183.1 L,D-transpeptidase [Oricola cellulosilytica]